MWGAQNGGEQQAAAGGVIVAHPHPPRWRSRATHPGPHTLPPQVLTPVRRSARKAAAPPFRAAGGVEAILEATDFCYEGNPVLTPAAQGERGKR